MGTALARRSKGYWGYDSEVLDPMGDMLAISAEQILAGHVVVADRDGALLGYYRLGGEPPHGELMDMFLDPAVIGTGLGRTLLPLMTAVLPAHVASSART